MKPMGVAAALSTLALLLCGCRTGTRLEVRGTFEGVWGVALGAVTNQGFVILSDKVPDPRAGRTCGLVEARRQAVDASEGAGGTGIISQREPWDQVRIAVCPIEPRTNAVLRRVTVSATTEKTDLLILKGRTQPLPELQAQIVEALLRGLAEEEGTSLAE